MKKLLVSLCVAFAGSFSFAQTILTDVSLTGDATASTQSIEDVWTRGGSPRTGFYYYWRPVVRQSTSMSVPLAFNAPTGLVTSTGDYYQPPYTANVLASTKFVNKAATALFVVKGQSMDTAIPDLPAHHRCSATASFAPRLYFTVPADTFVTITFKGAAPSGSNLYVLSGEIESSGNGYILAAGGTYCFWATWTEDAVLVPGRQNGSASLSFSLPD